MMNLSTSMSTPVCQEQPFVAQYAAVMHHNGGHIFREAINLPIAGRN